MSPGNIFDDPMFSLTENGVGPLVSPRHVTRELIPLAPSWTCIPRQHVLEDSIPQRHVAEEKHLMSLGIKANVVIHKEAQLKMRLIALEGSETKQLKIAIDPLNEMILRDGCSHPAASNEMVRRAKDTTTYGYDFYNPTLYSHLSRKKLNACKGARVGKERN
ncbi:hypothetical protein Tco_1282120 [Tanacetum coccineum]